MKIDKNKLKLGIWYEDEKGSVYRNESDMVEKPNEKVISYHTCFPLQISENVSIYYDNKDTCKHPLRFRKPTYGWIKGIKGCKCEKCGKTKTGKKRIPFVFMKWDSGNDTYPAFTGNSSIGCASDCIVAMVNSGDYKLDEALVVMANACERCMNVLLYKYLDGKDGYEEYSEQWKKCNTSCGFCERLVMKERVK